MHSLARSPALGELLDELVADLSERLPPHLAHNEDLARSQVLEGLRKRHGGLPEIPPAHLIHHAAKVGGLLLVVELLREDVLLLLHDVEQLRVHVPQRQLHDREVQLEEPLGLRVPAAG